MQKRSAQAVPNEVVDNVMQQLNLSHLRCQSGRSRSLDLPGSLDKIDMIVQSCQQDSEGGPTLFVLSTMFEVDVLCNKMFYLHGSNYK